MTRAQKIAVPLAALIAVHLLVVFAGFVAPYDAATQFREHPYAPPSRIHFRDEGGHFHIRPFVYAWKNNGNFAEYVEDTGRIMPIRFFVRGDQYTTLHFFRSSVHLFGVEEPAHIFILGSDGYGRDQFSRLLFGGQISLFSGLLAAALALALGLLCGSAGGYFGGLLDALLMRTSEVFLALPWLYLLFAVRAFLPLRMSPAGTFLLLIAYHRSGGVDSSCPTGTRHRVERERAQLCAGGARIWCDGMVPAAPSRLAANSRSTAYPGCSADSAIRTGGSHAVVSWARCCRTGSKLGEHAVCVAAIQRSVILLVDDHSRTCANSDLSQLLLIGTIVRAAV